MGLGQRAGTAADPGAGTELNGSTTGGSILGAELGCSAPGPKGGAGRTAALCSQWPRPGQTRPGVPGLGASFLGIFRA